jgi:hypothetical protein
MFPGDVVMDHTLPFHGSVYHPSLEGRLRGVGFGAWQKPCTTSAPTTAYLARGVVVTAPIPFGLLGEDLVCSFFDK